MTNVIDCDVIVNEVELQSRYYVHYRTNSIENFTSNLWIK